MLLGPPAAPALCPCCDRTDYPCTVNKFEQLEAGAASAQPPFVANGWRGNAHFQTIWPNRIQRDPAGARLAAVSTPRLIESEDGDRLRVFWSWHAATDTVPVPTESKKHGAPGEGRSTAAPTTRDVVAPTELVAPAAAQRVAAAAPAPSRGAPNERVATATDKRVGAAPTERSAAPRPVLVVLHGLTGCAEADNVMATAAKGFRLGFDVVRADLRNTQADDAPSLGIGHAGRSEDLRAILRHVADEAPGAPTAVIGFSLGGNLALKALGEYDDAPPRHLRTAATVSVPIDLEDACRAIDGRRSNWLYRTYFIRRLARRYLVARAARPDLFHAIDVDSIRGIRDWDNAVVAPLGGFADAEDYYARNSSLNVIGDIRVPTLVIHAQDDPFIPFGPFESEAVRGNDFLQLLTPRQGGHVGFFTTELLDGEPDRYWAENRALAHCAAAVGLGWGSGEATSMMNGGGSANHDDATSMRGGSEDRRPDAAGVGARR